MTKRLMFFSSEALPSIKINKDQVWKGIKNSPSSYDWIFPLLGDDCLVESPYSFDFDFSMGTPENVSAGDCENAIKLYEALHSLPKNVIFCEQFLSGFIFTFGYEYYVKRWADQVKDDPEDGLRHIFFVNGPHRAIAVNAVGRLLSRALKLVDESLGSEHKFDLLKKAFTMPICFQAEYYTFADNPIVYRAFVEAILDYSEKEHKLVDNEARALTHHLSMIQGSFLGEDLSEDEIKKMLIEYIPNCSLDASEE